MFYDCESTQRVGLSHNSLSSYTIRKRASGKPAWIEEKKGMADKIEFIVKKSEDGGYEANAVCHCICTQADCLDDLKEAVRDAVSCHFDEDELPEGIILTLGEGEVIHL